VISVYDRFKDVIVVNCVKPAEKISSFMLQDATPNERRFKNTVEPTSVRNPSVSLSPTLTRNEKVEHYIRIKTHKPIALRFWVESGVSILCG